MAGQSKNKGRWEFCDISDMREVFFSKKPALHNYLSDGTSSFEKVEKVENAEYFSITDGFQAQVVVVSNNKKYGVYILDMCYYGMDGPGIYVNPEKEAFPYDEVVAYCTIIGYSYIAFRIGEKWGILKVADIEYENRLENFTEIYSRTKRWVVVPCEYDSLDSARNMLFEDRWHM